MSDTRVDCTTCGRTGCHNENDFCTRYDKWIPKSNNLKGFEEWIASRKSNFLPAEIEERKGLWQASASHTRKEVVEEIIKLINILCNSLETPEDIQKFFYNPTTSLGGKTVVEVLEKDPYKTNRILRMAVNMFNSEDKPKVELLAKLDQLKSGGIIK